MMVKQWLFALLGLAIIWGIAPHGAAARPTAPHPISTPRVIRFRVIANSDNPVDQAIKLDVRDRVLETLDPVLNGIKSRSQAMAKIQALKPTLNEVANQVLARHHVLYHAEVKWTETLFPTKAYGSWVLPAGRYQALLIVLGQGAGHNWWCVLFPSLCFIDMGNALAVPSDVAVPATVPPIPQLPRPARALRQSTPRVYRPTPKHARFLPGAIRVQWTTPNFLTTFLAILRP